MVLTARGLIRELQALVDEYGDIEVEAVGMYSDEGDELIAVEAAYYMGQPVAAITINRD